MESKKDKHLLFPKNFYWGASTASHQVEGGTLNQWSVWELAHATELAKRAKERLSAEAFHNLPTQSIWPDIEKQATSPENYVSGKGVDHFRRYPEDLDIAAKQLNFNAFRFGIEWSRIEPEEGKWDDEAVQHYRTYIDEIKTRGMEPFLNIWHYTNPVWFEKKGGFVKKANLQYFDRFVQKVVDEFGAQINFVITINEPNVYATFSYLIGEWPPAQKNWLTFMRVYHNLALAHKRAYKILKHSHRHLQIGVAMQLANIQAKRPHNFFDQLSTKYMRYLWNWWFLKRVNRYQDFIGINYYYTDYYTGLLRRQNPRVPTNDMGAYMEPEGLYPLILRAWVRFKKPIYVTENGVPDAADDYRQWWLEETIIAMERAISEGVDLRGYFHWSLLDNFEWSYGWWPKFGLVHVDREHGMKRTIRPSAKWFAGIIKQTRT
jgi:beta-glucosidase